MVGELIKAARRVRHLTQDEFAAQLGINRATLSKYESNSIEPSSSMLLLISQKLKVPVSFLFGESSDQLISFDFQNRILSKIQERISIILSSSDPEDIYAMYGTYNINELYSDIFQPKLPVSLERIETIADEIGVTTEYLLGIIDDPDFTLEDIHDYDTLLKAKDAFSELNYEGQSKAIERIKELSEIPRYKKTPQTGADPSEA